MIAPGEFLKSLVPYWFWLCQVRSYVCNGLIFNLDG